MTLSFDTLTVNVRLATMQAADGGIGLIEDGAIATRGDRIAWVGAMRDLPDDIRANATKTLHGEGTLMTPGLIDCHTHILFGGDRVREFEQRLSGARYAEIARGGGGIRSTVAATRAMATSEGQLSLAAQDRLHVLMHEGVTTIEVKSGYALYTLGELQMLREARRLHDPSTINVATTLLGAHALPEEYDSRADEYIDLVCEEMIPRAKQEGLADAVDVFCENIGFNLVQTRRVFEAARAHGLPVKVHAEQLSNMGAARLAAEFGALSADHLEYLDEAGVEVMARAGTVATLLPGAFYFLRETRVPPIDLLRKHKVPMAVASDLNPGSSPMVSLQAAMNMACTLFRLTPNEVLRGVTVNAARALGMADRGVLAAGMRADFCVWNVGAPAELCYWLGGIRPISITVGGVERENTRTGWAEDGA